MLKLKNITIHNTPKINGLARKENGESPVNKVRWRKTKIFKMTTGPQLN